ncbi:uncharacterized protein N7511_008648 [Penicillium nucicola]|uniref:uncharacterized protein n=1 Tax=Penicillium nucicola TaxID=1850975 RepID=UPI0025454CE1|nr:uncharacterized protein N7511_008648 [Penicillium nucicola]KAJ5746952.1 hypothetical protein N7511_008648 [Penicillium nucicola]
MSDDVGSSPTNDANSRDDQDDTSFAVSSAASTVTEITGDLFTAPDDSALIHACNCEGVWGAGIARTFRYNYPAAYEIYRSHCQQHAEDRQAHHILNLEPRSDRTVIVNRPLGTALIISPQQTDVAINGRRHWVICLFTSTGCGRHVASQEMILNATWSALMDMQRGVDQINWSNGPAGQIQSLHGCRFNSGLFGVPWARTRRLIDRVGIRMVVHVTEETTTSTRRGARRGGRHGHCGRRTGRN